MSDWNASLQGTAAGHQLAIGLVRYRQFYTQYLVRCKKGDMIRG